MVMPVPDITMIPGGLRVGMVVSIRATRPSKYDRFSISFANGQDETSDIALQMNVRDDDEVTFNSRQGQVWGNEEVKKNTTLKSGKVFNIMFKVEKNNYQVFANGTRFFEYEHKIPLDEVNLMRVEDDIAIQELSILGN
ncbi:galectin-4-like [Anomaloglossus baeobatrachus]|uniref:galectin-4-like n=1 Tax=Anomaloglossus baeobatrachus TaxID=238106 RepID=UPI003F5004C3